MTKRVDQVKCGIYGSSVFLLFTLLIINAVQTHGNNVFRMQVAVGLDLEVFYCDETVKALRETNCI